MGNWWAARTIIRFCTVLRIESVCRTAAIVRGYVVAVRGGFNNITGHLNPITVDNVVGGPTFLRENGGQARAINFRLRLLWKQ